MLMMMVMLFVIVVTAAAVLIMLMMMVMLFVIVVTAAAVLLMVMMMRMIMLQGSQFHSQSGLALHRLNQLSAGELVPGSGHDGCLVIVLPDQRHGSIQLCLRRRIGTGQNDGGCGFDLIVVELTEVLHIDLHLAGIADSHGVAQSHILAHNLLHSADHIGQLAHAGGLDDHPVGMILGDDLLKSLAEVAHQAAADAAGVHFGNVDTGILQEAAINTDLAKLILDQHQLLTLVSFLNHLLDQGRLACAEKTGVNINFCHKNTF